jgi:hypothetical protein
MQLFENVTAPATAPACFAAASVFSHDSGVCQQCGAFGDCASASVKTLEAIQATINVSDLLRRHEAARKKQVFQRPAVVAPLSVAEQMAGQEDDEVVAAQPVAPELPARVERRTKVEAVSFGVSEDEATVIATLPKKSAEHAVRFIKNGLIDAMKRELPAGVNTFAQIKPEFMRVVCDALIAGGTTRSALKLRLMNTLDWGDTTASSHVSQIWPLFTRFDIAVEKDGVLTLTPASA